jgi:hypothetical protein
MYALGCVLLEIGLWQYLLDVKTNYLDPGLNDRIKEAMRSNKEVDLSSLWGLSTTQPL